MIWTRRRLLGLAGGAATMKFRGLGPAVPSAEDTGRARTAPAVSGPPPEITIAAPDLADARHPIPVGIRLGPSIAGQQLEWIELNLVNRAFPGLARFRAPAAARAIDCQVRLEQSETLLVSARLTDGTICRASHRITVSSVSPGEA